MKACLLASLLALSACATVRPGLDEQIVGRWEIDQIVRDGGDVTAQQDPRDERYFAFSANGTFRSGGAPDGLNTGRWSIDAETGELYIDSDAGNEDDSYWTVTIEGDRMTWRGSRGFARDLVLRFSR